MWTCRGDTRRMRADPFKLCWTHTPQSGSCAVDANENWRGKSLFLSGLKRQVFLYFCCNYVLIQCVKVKKDVMNESSPRLHLLSRHALQASPHLHPFSRALSIPALLHFTAWTPTEWKTAGLGTAQSALCPILLWIPHLPLLSSELPRSLSSFRWGYTAETKEKQLLWEHVSRPHMVLRCLSSFPSLCFPTWLPSDTLVLCRVLHVMT